MFTIRLAGLGCLATLLLAAEPPAGTPPDFQRDVRPILSNNCYSCHGPDKGARMANLRLDLRADAIAPRRSGAAIVPGDAAKSLAYQRIASKDAARLMPPGYAHKTLTPTQIDTLKRWIESGAEFKQHWSFVTPTRPAVPAVQTKGWAKTPIDGFILAKLEASGLTPAPEADRRRLIRRVTLDLTGLPPTPAEAAAFVDDRSPNAYEKVVDRLLASPHYGEHRARYWLDAARYADTHGIHVDNYREMWPYRDWVINAFNRNMPFDQFTIEQLAGDLLPNHTLDQQIASGFHRCNPTTNEAGTIEAEVLAMYAKDRVDTTGAVWLGLTIGCATCHDHKFDPLSQRDHYSMAAFFRNTTQQAMDGNISDTPPIVVVPTAADMPRWIASQQEHEIVRTKLEQARNTANPTFEKWLQSDQRGVITGPLSAKKDLLRAQVEDLTIPEGVRVGAGPGSLKSLEFGPKASLVLSNRDLLNPNQAFSFSVWVRVTGDDNFVIASKIDNEKRIGWVLQVDARVPLLRLGKNLEARAGHMDQLKQGEWNHIAVSYDGGQRQDGMAMFINGRQVVLQGVQRSSATIGMLLTSKPLLLGSDGKKYFEGGAIADFRILPQALTEDDAALMAAWPLIEAGRGKPAEQLTRAERDAFRRYYLLHEDREYRDLSARLANLDLERRDISRRASVSLVMNERTDQKPFANILYRGMYDQPRDRVEPDIPAALPPMASSYPRNRLGLAKWIVDESNPLTSRVIVNRYWQEMFGTGIVKTAEDFGSQGEMPTHPELLDWLAVEYRESGWDTKKLFKLMLMSSTYRQAAIATPEKLAKDPENRLLARGPRFRMDGEMIRDYALASSGLLTSTVGGPSVKPYQPDGVWETVAMLGSDTRFYKRDTGKNLYRRSMYTFWKRSAPPASMEIFNAPTREQCTVRRERTNTPLQALVTMNDVQFVEAARHLAQRALVETKNNLDREVDYVSGVLLARPLEEKERNIAKREYQAYMRYYDSHPDDARKLIAVGESKPDDKLPVPEFASLTMLVNQMLNLDEVLTK